jgi:hypothetical protein
LAKVLANLLFTAFPYNFFGALAMVAQHIPFYDEASGMNLLTRRETEALAQLFSVEEAQVAGRSHPLAENRTLVVINFHREDVGRALASYLNQQFYKVAKDVGEGQNLYAYADKSDQGGALCLTTGYDKAAFIAGLNALSGDIHNVIARSRHPVLQRGLRQRSLATLPVEERVAIINRNVQKIVDDSQRATDEIVATAMRDFTEEYRQIRSKRMRQSVLRNLRDDAGIKPEQPVWKPTNNSSASIAPPLRQFVQRFLSNFLPR